MGKKVVIHSFKGGTGKSNFTANLATAFVKRGKTVAAVDSDIKSPGLHFIFDVPEDAMKWKLNDYLRGECEIKEAVVSLTRYSDKLFLVPASLKAGEILRVLKEGYEVAQFNRGLSTLVDELDLDYLLIDTHPGLDEDTLLSIAASDVLIVIMRPDKQDYTGVAVSLGIASKMGKPTYIVINRIPSIIKTEEVVDKVKKAYRKPVLGAIQSYEEVAAAGSGEVFMMSRPLHGFSKSINQIAEDFLSILEK